MAEGAPAAVRVVQLATRLNIGGPARAIIELAKGLPRLGVGGAGVGSSGEGGSRFEVTVAAGTAAVSEGEMSDPEVPVEGLPLARRIDPITDVQALAAVRWLIAGHTAGTGRESGAESAAGRQVFRARRFPGREAAVFDVVHTHMAKAGALGRLAARSFRPRPVTVHTFHGHVLEGYFSRPAERVLVAAERVLAAMSDALVAVSAEIRDELLSMRIGRPGQWHVIPLGLDLDGYLAVPAPGEAVPASGEQERGSSTRPDVAMRESLDIPSGAPVVGMIGRLVPVKDHHTAFTAIARTPGVHLLVVGDGDERGRLESYAGSLGIADRVRFLGWRHDLPELLAAIDVVVLTSTNEGTPAALIEASAAARPVVATRAGGVPDVVIDGTSGLLVPPGAPEALAGALARLISDPAARRDMGIAGRDHVASRYGAGRFVAGTAALYEELLEARRHR